MWLLFACGTTPVEKGADSSTPTEESPTPTESTTLTPPDTADSTTPSSTPTCGDTTCDATESCWDCTSDCGACDCPTPAEVVLYTQSAWNVLADAFLADPSPCADYFLSLPANTNDKTTPRAGGEPEIMRERGARMHAMAEFQWTAWSAESGDWYDKGVEFRRRMTEAGYDVSAGDIWAINELPSSVRTETSVRQEALDAMRGLFDGPDGDGVQGAVFTVGMGHGTTNFSEYEPNVQDWLEDRTFWEQANLHARFWAQEVYADPAFTCVPDSSTGERSGALNAYVEHFARHAEVGPDSANTAQSYLGRAYVPLMNAVWGASGSGYGETDIPLEEMQHFVSNQVYAARAWSTDHNHPDGRLGFAWDRQDGVEDTDLEVLAARLASAIHYAYDAGGGSAAHACSPSGAYTWCQCSVSGASFNPGWETFESW